MEERAYVMSSNLDEDVIMHDTADEEDEEDEVADELGMPIFPMYFISLTVYQIKRMSLKVKKKKRSIPGKKRTGRPCYPKARRTLSSPWGTRVTVPMLYAETISGSSAILVIM